MESANYTADKIAGSNQFIIQRKSIDGVGVSLQGMSYIFKKSIPDFTVTQSFPNESGIGEYSYTLQPGVDYTYTPTQVDKFKVGQQDITIEGTGNFKGTKNSYFYYDGDMNNSADQIEVKLSYDTIEYDKAQAGKIIEKGNYLFLVIAGDSTKGYDREMQRAEQIIDGYFQ